MPHFADWSIRVWAVFITEVCAAWALGDFAMRPFILVEQRWFRSTAVLVRLILGVGFLGQLLFVAGIFAPVYRKGVIGPALFSLAIAGCCCFVRWSLHTKPISLRQESQRDRAWSIFVAIAAAGYACRWLVDSDNFLDGSDVFGHHYPHVHAMISAMRFAMGWHLPFGLDHFSNYNPSLVHLLYLPGHLLADERAANLIHWLTQVLLIWTLYAFGRQFGGRAAGAVAVGMFLSFGLLGTTPLDVQDYTLTTVFFLVSVMVVAMAPMDPRNIILAGGFGGLMASSKYYGLILLGPIAFLPLLLGIGPLRKRLNVALLYVVMSLVVFFPWVAWNLWAYGDPLFPFFSTTEVIRSHRVLNPLYTIVDFTIPADRSFLWPSILYWTSLFIRIEPGLAPHALSPIILAGLPISLWATARSFRANRLACTLFLVSAGAFGLLVLTAAPVAFYKWAFFPAALYILSLAILAQKWPTWMRQTWWVATILLIGTTYLWLLRGRLQLYEEYRGRTQEERWPADVGSILARVEPSATVAGVDMRTAYYLWPHVEGIVDDEILSLDWPSELAMMRRHNVHYFSAQLGSSGKSAAFYERSLALSHQLQPNNEQAQAFIDSRRHLNAKRFEERDAFLGSHGTLVAELPSGAQLFRISYDATSQGSNELDQRRAQP